MNIFYLSTDPNIAAQMHCDLHVIKMTLETAQLLSTAHWVLDPQFTDQLYTKAQNQGEKIIYRKTHVNHPCAIWVRENSHNYGWTSRLGLELLKEYSYRFEKIHATTPVLDWLSKNYPPSIKDSIKGTPPPQAMNEEYKHNNPIIAYRKYYFHEKYRKKEILRRYTKRKIPNFLLKADPYYPHH
ncbi:MAG: hypothetical protein ACFFDT_40550 [Candidatus Hodarchaeota archaeon]